MEFIPNGRPSEAGFPIPINPYPMNTLIMSNLAQKLELFGEQACQTDPSNFDDYTIKEIEGAFVLKISAPKRCMGFQAAKDIEARLKAQSFDVSRIAMCVGNESYICLEITVEKE